jgi:hypothetical protein
MPYACRDVSQNHGHHGCFEAQPHMVGDRRSRVLLRKFDLFQRPTDVVADLCIKLDVTCGRQRYFLYRELHDRDFVGCQGFFLWFNNQIVRDASHSVGATKEFERRIARKAAGVLHRRLEFDGAGAIRSQRYCRIIDKDNICIGGRLLSHVGWLRASEGHPIASARIAIESHTRPFSSSARAGRIQLIASCHHRRQTTDGCWFLPIRTDGSPPVPREESYGGLPTSSSQG